MPTSTPPCPGTCAAAAPTPGSARRFIGRRNYKLHRRRRTTNDGRAFDRSRSPRFPDADGRRRRLDPVAVAARVRRQAEFARCGQRQTAERLAQDRSRRLDHRDRRPQRDGTRRVHRAAHAARGGARGRSRAHRGRLGAGGRGLRESGQRRTDHGHEQQRAGCLGEAANGGRAGAAHADRRRGQDLERESRAVPRAERRGDRPRRQVAELRQTRRCGRTSARAQASHAEVRRRVSADRQAGAAPRYAGQGGRQRPVRHRCAAAGHAVRGARAEPRPGRQGRGGRFGLGIRHAGRAPGAVRTERRYRGGGSFLAGPRRAQRAQDRLGSGREREARQCRHRRGPRACRGHESRHLEAQGRRCQRRSQEGRPAPRCRVRTAPARACADGADELHR